MDAEHQASGRPGPVEAWRLLCTGNRRFAGGTPLLPRRDGEHRRRAAADVQRPLAAVLACADSRCPVELIFDQGIGDLFTVRVAGNGCDRLTTASLEYAVDQLGCPLLIVLGHTGCGAVTAAANPAGITGCSTGMLPGVQRAVAAARREYPEAGPEETIHHAVQANVRLTIAELKQTCPVIANLAGSGRLLITGGVYDMASGVVDWLDPPGELTD